MVLEFKDGCLIDLSSSLSWHCLGLINDVVQLLIILKRLHLHLILRDLRLSLQVLLLLLLLLQGVVLEVDSGVSVIVRVLLVFLLELGLFVVTSDLVENSQIFKEVVFISIESKNLEDANHLVVSVLHQAVEEGNR